MKFVITCAAGTEVALEEELRTLAIEPVGESPGSRAFEGTLEDAYRVGLWSRVGSRILLTLTEFDARDPDALYAHLVEMPWEDHLSARETLVVDCVTSRDRRADHSRFLSLKSKDAVVDRLRNLTGERPNIDRDDPDVRLHLRWADPVVVSIDLHGPLHRRGYRQRGSAAPLRENLAAAILMLSGWKPGEILLDPMCGSGTILVEAGWMVRDVAPGLSRTRLGRWRGHEMDVWNRLVDEAKARRQAASAKPLNIFGSDLDPRAVKTARRALEAAGLSLPVKQVDVRDVEPPTQLSEKELAHIVVNPPYGERLGSLGELAVLYGQLGDALKQRFGGWSAHVLAPPELIGSVGLKPKRRHVLYNGPLECRLATFPITARKKSADGQRAWGKDAEPFVNRLRKNKKKLSGWAKGANLDAYRLYDADIPEFNVAVDILREHVMVSEYARPKRIDPKRANARLKEVMRIVPIVLQVESRNVHLRVRARTGEGQYEKRAEMKTRIRVREGAFTFLVNLEDYLDVGLFPDQRTLRKFAAETCGERRFLNLYAYTCSASVVAAAAGATTTSVDLSRNYLDWGAANFEANELEPRQHEFVRSDVQEFLDRTREEWAVVYLNPPSYSRSKAMKGDFVLERDQVRLIRAAMSRTTDTLFFSTHARGFRLDDAIERDFEVESIAKRVVPRDYLRSPFQVWAIRARSAK